MTTKTLILLLKLKKLSDRKLCVNRTISYADLSTSATSSEVTWIADNRLATRSKDAEDKDGLMLSHIYQKQTINQFIYFIKEHLNGNTREASM